jgi:hypothetical protein
MVPAHLQGDINGSHFSFSSPRQILQTLPSTILACYSFSFNLSFYFCFRILCHLHYQKAQLRSLPNWLPKLMTKTLQDQDGLLPLLHQILKTFQHWCEPHFIRRERYQFAAKEDFNLYH